jgi:GDP/UDP-N,N'-diacetylbacillosamine 2-epimerase (hydrolysing)
VRLLFLNGSRGEWGYIRPIIELCQERDIEYGICATNMLLLSSHGSLVDEMESEGFNVTERILMSLEGHTHHSMAKSLGVFLTSFVDVLMRQRPDWLVLAGDRGEQLMGAIAAAYAYVPVCHIQAGERSGNIDGVARHAIGKFVHLHFAANRDAADRLLRLGEEEFRIHEVGAPQLDELRAGVYSSVDDLRGRYDIDPSSDYLLVVQHPVTEEYERAEEQVDALVDALDRVGLPRVWILPNNDAGSDRVRRRLLSRRTRDTKVFANLTRSDFLGFLANSSCIVGNSSAGLLEAPTFGVPAVNLGGRQRDRVQGSNVINAEYDVDAIEKAISQALDPAFRATIAGAPNPYGDGRSAERIVDTLLNTPIDDRLLLKRLTY